MKQIWSLNPYPFCRYIKCFLYNGLQGVNLNCTGSTLFNPTLGYCDSAYTCTSTTSTTTTTTTSTSTTTTTTTTTATTAASICAEKATIGLFADTSDTTCKQYINSNLYRYKCGFQYINFIWSFLQICQVLWGRQWSSGRFLHMLRQHIVRPGSARLWFDVCLYGCNYCLESLFEFVLYRFADVKYFRVYTCIFLKPI